MRIKSLSPFALCFFSLANSLPLLANTVQGSSPFVQESESYGELTLKFDPYTLNPINKSYYIVPFVELKFEDVKLSKDGSFLTTELKLGNKVISAFPILSAKNFSDPKIDREKDIPAANEAVAKLNEVIREARDKREFIRITISTSSRYIEKLKKADPAFLLRGDVTTMGFDKVVDEVKAEAQRYLQRHMDAEEAGEIVEGFGFAVQEFFATIKAHLEKCDWEAEKLKEDIGSPEDEAPKKKETPRKTAPNAELY